MVPIAFSQGYISKMSNHSLSFLLFKNKAQHTVLEVYHSDFLLDSTVDSLTRPMNSVFPQIYSINNLSFERQYYSFHHMLGKLEMAILFSSVCKALG